MSDKVGDKISLGAGTEIETEKGWVNLDLLPLEGIDVVHNLAILPYPFKAGSAYYIKAKDVIEHLPNYTQDLRPMIVAFMEEMYRILQPQGILWIQTPGHDAAFAWADPTHVRTFTKDSMDFFDPSTDFGKAAGFYSKAQFSVTCEVLENKNLQFVMVKE